jgi:hypothetical protein
MFSFITLLRTYFSPIILPRTQKLGHRASASNIIRNMSWYETVGNGEDKFEGLHNLEVLRHAKNYNAHLLSIVLGEGQGNRVS